MASIKEMLEQGPAHQRAGRLREAERAYRAVLAAAPEQPDALHLLGVLIANAGRPDKGIPLMERAVAAAPTQGQFRTNLANALRKAGRLTEAVESFKDAIRIDARNAMALHGLGHAYEQMHRLKEARDATSRAIAARPGFVNAVVQLARIDRREGRLAEGRERLEVLLSSELAPGDVCHARMELGHILDRAGEYAAAYRQFEIGQATLAATLRGPAADRDAYLRVIAGLRDTITGADFDAWARRGGDARTPADPVFLLGFPRSGTTLTESILDAHPAVRTTDERPFLHQLIGQIGRMGLSSGYPAALRELDGDQIESLRASYWAAAEDRLGTMSPGEVFVDKLPLNIINIALIARVFPQSRIILALRDPRDVCLSCFMQEFEPNQAMGHFMALETTVTFYEAVMGLWRQQAPMMGLPVHIARYEDTVSDLERAARPMIEFLGLPWDASVLSFHERAATRAVSTPSYAAIAAPVHQGAVARWRRYEAFFEPLMATLMPAIDAFGYGEPGTDAG